ncbi:CotH kinase family protein [Melittangium boletus]|uniref:EF-hand domain-containing protein n=1 Tax=Melittangium boletus DSM 14713 TaxID=1294270 RepID=A0A250IBM9_9BACT|nr:CotH kinase family protein [Melittangium boletus]ATB28547.1 hypothetical protein MEBOL_001996 [Melittangium boletus DSM 14713]
MKTKWGVVLLAMVGGSLPSVQARAEEKPRPAPQTAEQLFQPTTVWNVHLTFTPEQWAELEPKPIARKPEGRPHFSPGMLFAPYMLGAGDADRSGTLSQAEFQALTERWFSEWDEAKRGGLNHAQVRDGLNAAFNLNVMENHKSEPDEPRSDDVAAALGVQFQYVHADLELEGRVFKDVAVRYKGNFSYAQSRDELKRSLKVDLDRFVKDQNLGGLSKLNFHSSVVDASWMNEVLSHRLYRDAGVAAPRTAYARVTLTVPGKYDRQFVGLYSLVENVDSAFERMHFQSDKGALFKPVMPDMFTDLGDDWAAYQRRYYPRGKLSKQQQARLIAFSKLVSHASDKDFAARLEQFLDVETFCRYLAVTTYLSTLDSFLMVGHNFNVHLDARGQKFRFIPWDLDSSFGQFGLIDNEKLETLSITHPWQGNKRFLERFMQVPKFKSLYLARMKELNQKVFKPARVQALVDETATAIRPFVAQESEQKLARFNKLAEGQSVPPMPLKGMGIPGDGDKFDAGSAPIRPIKPFAEARSRSIAEQLAGKSQGYVLKVSPIGPGMFFGRPLLAALDTNKDGEVSHDEFTQTFARWFEAWDTDKSGALTAAQVQAGFDRALLPPAAPASP